MEKLSDVISFILKNSPNGRTKRELAKLVYYSDGVHFQKHAKIISTQKYIHTENYPLPIELTHSLVFLKENGFIDIQPRIGENGLNGFYFKHLKDTAQNLVKEEKRVIKKVLEAFKNGVIDESRQYPNLYENYVIAPLYSEIPFSVTTINTKIHLMKRKSLLNFSGKIFRVLFDD